MTDAMPAWLSGFFHGWKELVLLFVILLLASALFGWLVNRRLRPSERGRAINAPLVLAAFAVLLIAKFLQQDHLSAIIIACGLAVMGFVTSRNGSRAAVLTTVMLAVLLGFGLHLSAVVFFLAAALVLYFNRPASHDKRSSR